MFTQADVVEMWQSSTPLPPLPDRIAESLREDGRSLCFAADALSQSAFKAIAALAKEFADSDKVKQAVQAVESGTSRTDTKQFLVKYGERNDLLISQFAKLQPIIDKACGEEMQPYHCDMWYVIPTDRPREWSQNWHRDRDGSTVVKVFCYFTDVTEESGPLEYVVGSHAGKHSDIVTPERSYATAEEAERIKPEDVATLTVPAGTMAFVNTTGLHRGGYAKSQPRICAVWTFVRK